MHAKSAPVECIFLILSAPQLLSFLAETLPHHTLEKRTAPYQTSSGNKWYCLRQVWGQDLRLHNKEDKQRQPIHPVHCAVPRD